jgi:hypothetical protein
MQSKVIFANSHKVFVRVRANFDKLNVILLRYKIEYSISYILISISFMSEQSYFRDRGSDGQSMAMLVCLPLNP